VIGIFGAGGFIGQHLTNHFAGGGRDVVAVSRSFGGPTVGTGDTRRGRVGHVRRVEADFRDREAMWHCLSGVETVVQLVSSSSPAMGNSNFSGDIRENVIPHAEFLSMCVQAGVQRVVFLSSGGTVYGPHRGHRPIPETAATNPISSYGLTKLMVEKLIAMHGHIDQLDYVVLRVSNPFGPGQVLKKGQGLIPALLDRYQRGEPITVFGDGSATRDYIYVDDLLRAVSLSVGLAGHRQLTLNLGTGVGRSVMDVVRAIEDLAGIAFAVEHVPARETDVDHVRLDISRARETLGWEPQVSFEDGLARTLMEYGRLTPSR
jgi:UDP-glucose 4-epimerase